MWATFSVSAQKQKQDSTKVSEKLFRNFRIEADMVPLAMLAFGNTESYSFEGAVQATFLRKYYPVFEAGFAGAEKTAYNNIHFKTAGPFARIGLDFDVMKPKPGKKPTNNHFLAGVRIGYSAYSYQLNNVSVTQDYWNETITRNYTNIEAQNAWFEIVAGIRVEIIPKLYMGWSVRNKNRFGETTPGEFHSYYIPGFGKNKSSNWGVNYSIGYMF
ncbi:MAG: DUF6048 family protein [Paludibacter sp.]|nr:DUF6048 family protein [Paludibacter sp.]